ncbi:MAG: restriction endonuclease subunit S [Bacteroidota bacterium]
MKKTKLSKIIKTLESGSRPKGGSHGSGVVSIGGGQISPTGGFKFSKAVFIPKPFYNKLKKGKIENGDILIVKDGATTGKTSFVSPDNFPYKEAAINEHVFRIVVNEEIVVSKYVFYYLFGPNGQMEIQKDFRGAAIGGITRKFVDKVEIPLPDLQTQNKIVAVLDKASQLLQKREESIQLLDELLRAQFLEMFGDPVLNHKGWEQETFKNTIKKIDSGWSPVCKDHPRTSKDKWAVLKQGAVSRRKFNPNENKELPDGLAIKKEVTANKGDVLFSRKNSTQFVGATVYLYEHYEKLLLPDTIFKLIYKEDVLKPLYLLYLFNDQNFKLVIQGLRSGAAGSMPNISKSKLNSLKIILPSLSLQESFQNIAIEVYNKKKKLKASKEQLQNLFNSILQRAFNGQLNFKDETALNTLLDAIDVEADTNDLRDITFVYLRQLIEKLSEQDFEDMEQYKKAKHAAFQLLREGKLTQTYQEDSQNVNLEIV